MTTHDTAGTARGEMTMDTEHGEHREMARLIGDVRRAERERDEATARAERAEAQHATVLASLTHALAQGDALNAEAKAAHDRAVAAEVRATIAEARVAEMEAIIAGRTTPPTEADEVAAFRAGLRVIRLGARWHVYDADGRPCAWPAAEVSR